MPIDPNNISTNEVLSMILFNDISKVSGYCFFYYYFFSNGETKWQCCDNKEEKNGICIGEILVIISRYAMETSIPQMAFHLLPDNLKNFVKRLYYYLNCIDCISVKLVLHYLYTSIHDDIYNMFVKKCYNNLYT